MCLRDPTGWLCCWNNRRTRELAGRWPRFRRYIFIQPGARVVPFLQVSGGALGNDIYRDHTQKIIGGGFRIYYRREHGGAVPDQPSFSAPARRRLSAHFQRVHLPSQRSPKCVGRSSRVDLRLLNLALPAPRQTRATKKGSPRISNHESTLMHTNEEWLFESIRGHSTLAWLPRVKPPRPRKAAPEFRTTNQH